jgi:uncharacterized protein YdbL (DUF1318 family)
MNSGKSLFSITLPIFTIVLFACVTINIYFPAEKVETMAEGIVEDIRGKEDKKSPKSSDPKPYNQDPSKKDSEPLSHIFRLLDIIGPRSVFAQEATEVSNATIRALKEKMRKRYPQMKSFFTQGVIKEGDNGYIIEGDTRKVDLKTRSRIKKLMKAENGDRKKLYKEVAAALKIDPSQIQQIEEIFTEQWKKSAP